MAIVTVRWEGGLLVAVVAARAVAARSLWARGAAAPRGRGRETATESESASASATATETATDTDRETYGVVGSFFGSHEFGAFGSSFGPGMHIGPSLVGATGIIAQVELGGVVPSLTCVRPAYHGCMSFADDEPTPVLTRLEKPTRARTQREGARLT